MTWLVPGQWDIYLGAGGVGWGVTGWMAPEERASWVNLYPPHVHMCMHFMDPACMNMQTHKTFLSHAWQIYSNLLKL